MFDVPATGCWSLFSLCGSDTTRPERPVAIGPRLVVGTLNLIADNENPWQFMPPESDQSPQFAAQLEMASKSFDAVTIDDALEILDAAVEGAAATEGAEARAELAGRVRLWARGAAGFEASASISQLAASGKLDLSLDNKFVPDEGRLNPLIFGLSRVERGVETQMAAARRDARAFASRVADAFVAWEERQRTAAAARARAKGRRMSINGDFDAATLSLMLWDLHCTISYAQASG